MGYPTANPKNKHDLHCKQPVPPPSESLVSQLGYSSSSELFQSLDISLEDSPPPTRLCSVYSYPDGPDYPGPLARSLYILGVATSSISLVRKVLNAQVPDCLHKCTVAVQLADPKHFAKLDERHRKNSEGFSSFMQRLRKEEAVAILGKDKYGRFGMLVPIGVGDEEEGNVIAAEDCYAYCYVGDSREVMEFLTRQVATSAPTKLTSESTTDLWRPPGTETAASDAGNEFSAPWDTSDATTNPTESAPWESNEGDSSYKAPWETNAESGNGDETSPWENHDVTTNGNKRSFDDMNQEASHETDPSEDAFHGDSTAAAADAFYSGLTRSLDTRADSFLYHMRAFNGWVKATQIQELDPRIVIKGAPQPKRPLRVLDLACGKGGDLNKWTLHDRGLSNYVGIDVARGSLKDAAIRAREMRNRRKLSKAVFTCADLGSDVPGRKKSSKHKHMQKLLTWSIEKEDRNESRAPEFTLARGGGITESDRFDVVSIQFAIHYMMSTKRRARRFFDTVSKLLEIGGNLICTTIDARVVVEHLMNLGLNYHFDDDLQNSFEEAVVEAGAGACKLKFEPDVVRKLYRSEIGDADDIFGLEYKFTLVEGSDHAAGVGDAVNLPEWLTPIPVLQSLGKEAGLELEYAQNFHEFYDQRKDPSTFPAAHLALYNMKVLNKDGTISDEEWSVSRMYAAIKFRKVAEPAVNIDDDVVEEESEDEAIAEDKNHTVQLDPAKAKKMLPMAMMKAKKSAGESWDTLSSEEKKKLTQIELEKIAAM